MFGQKNRVKVALEEGEVTLGSLTLLQEPAIGEILGLTGFDFLVIDTEHAAADEQTVLAMVRACEAANVTPIVRVRRGEEKELLWALDTGAGGVLVPILETAEQARDIVRFTHYPPVGDRTLCSASRAAGHGTQRGDFTQFLEWFNSSVVTIGLVETPEGLRNLDEIASSGIDILMLGRADLSLKMGLGYAPGHPQVQEAAEDFVDRVTAGGAAAGVLAYSAADALEWIRRGVRFVAYSQPEMILSDAYRQARQAITDGLS